MEIILFNFEENLLKFCKLDFHVNVHMNSHSHAMKVFANVDDNEWDGNACSAEWYVNTSDVFYMYTRTSNSSERITLAY